MPDEVEHVKQRFHTSRSERPSDNRNLERVCLPPIAAAATEGFAFAGATVWHADHAP